jgi:signal transduction histidine kinase
MDHRTPYPITQMIEIEIHDKQGRPIWLMFNMVPIINDDGQVDRYFGMCRNVTDLVETEQRLVVETKKAQETELLKQSFLTNMSYELRTPLNTVVGFAELFEAEHEPEDEPFFVEQIKSSSNTLLQLINDVLLLSRLDAGMEEYKKAEVDFELIFSNYCQVDTIAEGSKAEVVVDHPYKSLVVDIDVQHLGMAIERLCKLAAFYAKKGVVKTSYEYRRGELTISVEDNGVGVPPEVIPHFFDRFTRSKAGILYGTGLDLPIIKALTEQMGGSVEMTSELGKGSTVWISVPCEAKNIERRRDNNTNLSELSEL